MDPTIRRGPKTPADFWRPVFEPEPDAVLPTPLLEGVITPGIWFLAGKDKLGKTLFAQAFALTLATGHPFLGLPLQGPPQRVLYIDEQMGPEVMDERFQMLCNGYDDELIPTLAEHLSRVSLTGFRLSNTEQRVMLAQAVKDLRVNWAILDPLITMATWKQLEHTDEGQELSEYLWSLYHDHSCSLLLLNHAVKMQRRDQTRPSEWMLGSFPLRSTASGCLGLIRNPKTEQRRLVVQSNLLGVDHSLALDWEGSGGQGPDEWLALTLRSDATPGRPWLDDLVGLPYPLTLREMAEKLGMPEVTKKFRKRVDAAVAGGMLKVEKGPHGVQIFHRA